MFTKWKWSLGLREFSIATIVDSVETGGTSERDASITVCMKLDGKPVTMEVDTGAAKTITCEETLHKLWPGRGLDKTDVRLQSYLGEPIQVVGSAVVNTTVNPEIFTVILI